MRILQNIKEKLFPTQRQKAFDTSFVFPYSNDKEVKRNQMWENLQKGILFEDTKILIPWLTPFAKLETFAEQRKDSGDRTDWFLGKHQILDDYTCHAGVMKWIFVKNSKPFSEIEDWLGFDYEGNEKFLLLKDKLTDLLGEPTKIEMDKFGVFDVGSVEWTNQKVRIRLSGIEQFACKYRLYIGLTENPNW
ncbi:MAG: hypothetical protein ACKVU0_17560 [Saprospiraceae bacterium]